MARGCHRFAKVMKIVYGLLAVTEVVVLTLAGSGYLGSGGQ